MIIKLTGIFDDEIGTHPAKRIEGTKIDNGEKWDRKIFANAKDLRGQLAEFGIGDTINVKMEKNGKYWNVVGFEEASEALIKAAKENSSGGGAPSGGSGGGAKKSTWGGRSGEAYDRSSSIYLALEVLKENKTAKGKVKPDEMIALADIFNDYIHDGVNAFDKVEGSLDDIMEDLG